jgi:sporulation inhibitor KapD
MREIKGQIHSVSVDYKLISVQIVNRLEFFYLQPRFVKQFRQYLYPGAFVIFSAYEEKFKMRRRQVAKIETFLKIIGNRYHRKFSYFDQKVVKTNILEKISQYDHFLFLDLEMTIKQNRQDEVEIIQAGAILVNSQDEILHEYNHYIKPTITQTLSDKTLDFLQIKPSLIEKGISYQTFYDQMTVLVKTYHPAIIVWGNNDQIALKKSYELNQVKPLFNDDDFINMQIVHKEFYNINYELGLFNTALIYGVECGDQAHDAYVDALVTREVFQHFYDMAKHDILFDFKKEMLKGKLN